jgi:hypothetical protein
MIDPPYPKYPASRPLKLIESKGRTSMLPAYCDGINRRGFLRVGSLAGLSLAEILRLQETRASEPAPSQPVRTKKDVN